MKNLVLMLLICAVISPVSAQEETFSPDTTPPHPALLKQEFVYTEAPFPQCHATTIIETPNGLLAAWFGGTREKNPDVEIWVSRFDGQSWTPVESVANGIQNDDFRYPCWNPVLYREPGGRVLLFYKVGANPREWWGELITSCDSGQTWSSPVKLPEGYLGPVKNKPELMPDGRLLCPTSTEHDGWKVHMEWTRSHGRWWWKTGALNSPESIGAIQPAILKWGNRLQILCRSQQKHIASAWSNDYGRTWSEMVLIDELPNPNSGIDAVSLKNGQGVLIYNDTPKGRSPLNVAVSTDGEKWKNVLVLENQPGEYSYPAVIQTSDGLVHVTYTWKRHRVKHVVLDPAKF